MLGETKPTNSVSKEDRLAYVDTITKQDNRIRFLEKRLKHILSLLKDDGMCSICKSTMIEECGCEECWYNNGPDTESFLVIDDKLFDV